MERANILNLVLATVANHLNRPEHGISESSELFDDLGADSLDIVELTLIFEEMFQVEISDDDLENCTSVGDIVNLIEEKEPDMGDTTQPNPQSPQRPNESNEDYAERLRQEQADRDQAEQAEEAEGLEDDGEGEEQED